MTGFGVYLLHDPLPLRGGALHVDDDAFAPGPAPPLELHLGASPVPHFSFDLAVALRWAHAVDDPGLRRHDSAFWVAGRVYPWKTDGVVAPFAEVGAGVTTRSVSRSPCVFACRTAGAVLPPEARPLLVAGLGAEWFPGAGGFHLITRLDARTALASDAPASDVLLSATAGLGWRWR